MGDYKKSPFEKDFPAVAEKFPKLTYGFNKKVSSWIVKGDLDICDITGAYWNTFIIRIVVPDTYPYCVPIVQEISAVIPRDINWHIDRNGVCCLDIDHRLLFLSRKGIRMAEFVAEKVYSYFANQLYKLKEGNYAGAEYAHYIDGVVQFYEEDLRLNSEQAISFLQRLTGKSPIRRNELCPCGSNRKFKRCHWDIIEFLKCMSANRLKEDLNGFKELVCK